MRQNLRYAEEPGINKVLILSGDQLYRIDFRHMIAAHEQSGADVTIAAVPVREEAASGLGIMRVDETGRVVGFLEKPQNQTRMRSGPHRSQMDRLPRFPKPRPRSAGKHGNLPVQSPSPHGRARQDRLPRLRQRSVSRLDSLAQGAGLSFRRLLGRHRHDQIVLRGESRPGGRRCVVRFIIAEHADLFPGKISPSHARRGGDYQRQPDRRRLADRNKAP